MLTTDDLARLRELLAATNGPYTAADESIDIGRGMLMHKSVVQDKDGENVIRLGYTDPQVHLFALSANALPELLRVYEAALAAPEVKFTTQAGTFICGNLPDGRHVKGESFRLVPLATAKGGENG